MGDRIIKLEKGIRKVDGNLKRLEIKEGRARGKWTKEYHKFFKASADLVNLRRYGTKRHQRLKEIISSWMGKTEELTRARDNIRISIAEQRAEMAKLKIKLSGVIEKDTAEEKATNEIVDQVFLLNNSVIAALETRNHFLSNHVYNLLVDEKGRLRSQLTFVNYEGTRKVVALVNTIQLVLPDLALKALKEIEQFFARFRPAAEMDKTTQTLYNLTKKLLVEKARFKIGPDLYRFISLELDRKTFPELREAQDLLKRSLRSEKTSSYIRLYKRVSRADKWMPIKQT